MVLNCRADPPHRKRRQPDTPIWVKAFDCFQQPDSSFLYQIGERAAVAPIPPGDPDDKAELA